MRRTASVLRRPFAKPETAQDPKVFAFYFPQFHADPLNSALWGPNYTDWDRVRQVSTNRKLDPVVTPSELGYYDLMGPEVRRQQAALARRYGVDGFIYHHYWFYSDAAPVLAGPLQQLLLDGEPNIRFAFHWANVNWTQTWNGVARGAHRKRLLFEQFFAGSEADLREHYAFLRPFFHHCNYIRVQGAPLFLIMQTTGAHADAVARVALGLVRLAMLDGFPGLHIPTTHSNRQMLRHVVPTAALPFSGVFYFPQPQFQTRTLVLPPFDGPGLCNKSTLPVYYSTYTEFDNSPRRELKSAQIIRRSPKELEHDLVLLLMYSKCCVSDSARAGGADFVLLNAWNEWGEGMVLEPSVQRGYSFLEAVLRAKSIATGIGCDDAEFKVRTQIWDGLKKNVGAF